MLSPQTIEQIVALAIQEDVGSGDITAGLLVPHLANATIITRENAIICGVDFVTEVYRQLDPTVCLHWQVKDGQAVSPNESLCQLTGINQSLLTGERTALNFLQTLSGTATTTRQYVEILAGTTVTLLDTRKTIPGLRAAQKYAVICGGGKNHRLGLFDAYLIKENHIISCGSIAEAVDQARQRQPGKCIEVEVENFSQLQEALNVRADVIMLDNFTLDQVKMAVQLTNGQAKLEVSGNITQAELAKIAAVGIDYISVGALTKHVRAIDLSMRVTPCP